ARVGNGGPGATKALANGNSPRSLTNSDAFRVPGPDLMDAAKADSAAARTAAAQAKAQKSIADQARGKGSLLQDQAAAERKLAKSADPNDPHNKAAADLEKQAKTLDRAAKARDSDADRFNQDAVRLKKEADLESRLARSLAQAPGARQTGPMGGIPGIS